MPLMWIGFNVFVILMLALDLGVFHKKVHEVKIKEAVVWTVVWIILAGIFNILIYLFWDRMAPGSGYTNTEAAMTFLTGYLIEKSLSVDNIFVFLVVFTYFQVPALFQHKILFWGIFGALIMRAVFIFTGIALITKFHWMIYLFGILLVVTGIKMVTQKDKKIDPGKNPIIKIFKKWFNVSNDFSGSKFFTKINGKRFATPMLIVLLFIETTDLIFAVDSIPAILAITNNPFIVYTSNVFAILGLRSIYFALSGIMNMFYYLHYGLSAILIFVGAKMILTDVYKIQVEHSLFVVLTILLLSILLSKFKPPVQTPKRIL